MNESHIMIYNQIIPQTCLSKIVSTVDRIIQAIGKHVIAKYALAGGGVGVGVDESAQFGIVITGLEVVERGLSVVDIATLSKSAVRVPLCNYTTNTILVNDMVVRHITLT